MSLFTDTYYTITAPAEADLRERGSKFLAYAYPLQSEADVKKYLALLKKKYPDATHHCYAYRLGIDQAAYRASDDGEPANSAGRPILRAIQSLQLSNVLVVVVRYFGGKLLGVPGLIEAYGGAATLALKKATIVEKALMAHYTLFFPFEAENEAYRLLRQVQAKIETYRQEMLCEIDFAIRQGQAEQIAQILKEYHTFECKYRYSS